MSPREITESGMWRVCASAMARHDQAPESIAYLFHDVVITLFGWTEGSGVHNLSPIAFGDDSALALHQYLCNSLSYYCNGQIVGQPRNGNVDKHVRKCRTNVRKMSTKDCPEGLKHTISDIFWTIFAYLVDAFVW